MVDYRLKPCRKCNGSHFYKYRLCPKCGGQGMVLNRSGTIRDRINGALDRLIDDIDTIKERVNR